LPNPFEPPKQSVEIDLPTSWKDVPWIVAAGRLIPIKRFDILIKAISPMAERVKLLILGEGPERAKLEALILSEKLEGKVLLKGEVNDPCVYFEHAACCVVSSELEGFPNVLLEMMYANGAVVSTLCADGIAELPGVVKCEPNNVSALEMAINSALSLSNNEVKKNKEEMSIHLNSRTFQNYWENILINIK
jgi:glycosyltransferase involved in cell wall biosynthesis